MFNDRVDAGERLAKALSEYAGAPNTVVLGIPRGGVVVAAEVARVLDLPLDILAAAKIGAPDNPEFAVGAVTPDGEVIANPRGGMATRDVAAIAGPAREKIRRQLENLRGSQPAVPVAGRTVIVVDDGLATGLTALAAVRYLKRQGASVILAVPVAASDSARALKAEVDRLVALDIPHSFQAVGQFYQTFGQTEDDEVRALLAAARSR